MNITEYILQGIVEVDGDKLKWTKDVKSILVDPDTGLAAVVLQDGTLYDGFCKYNPDEEMMMYKMPIKSEGDYSEMLRCRKQLTEVFEKITLQRILRKVV